MLRRAFLSAGEEENGCREGTSSSRRRAGCRRLRLSSSSRKLLLSRKRDNCAGRARVYFSSIVIFLIFTGLVGRSLAPVGAVTILSTTSSPLLSFPKTVYLPSRLGYLSCMTKNWLPALF